MLTSVATFLLHSRRGSLTADLHLHWMADDDFQHRGAAVERELSTRRQADLELFRGRPLSLRDLSFIAAFSQFYASAA
jgi:hypothetical protein